MTDLQHETQWVVDNAHKLSEHPEITVLPQQDDRLSALLQSALTGGPEIPAVNYQPHGMGPNSKLQFNVTCKISEANYYACTNKNNRKYILVEGHNIHIKGTCINVDNPQHVSHFDTPLSGNFLLSNETLRQIKNGSFTNKPTVSTNENSVRDFKNQTALAA